MWIGNPTFRTKSNALEPTSYNITHLLSALLLPHLFLRVSVTTKTSSTRQTVLTNNLLRPYIEHIGRRSTMSTQESNHAIHHASYASPSTHPDRSYHTDRDASISTQNSDHENPRASHSSRSSSPSSPRLIGRDPGLLTQTPDHMIPPASYAPRSARSPSRHRTVRFSDDPTQNENHKIPGAFNPTRSAESTSPHREERGFPNLTDHHQPYAHTLLPYSNFTCTDNEPQFFKIILIFNRLRTKNSY